MEIGFNNDVIYRGSTFHIQTEDHGKGDQRVSSQLFYSGAILDTRTVSYANLVKDIADTEARKSKIRKVMVKSHRSLYKRLFNGEYDSYLGDKLADAPPAEMPPPEDFQPSQERVPEVANVLEEDGKVTFTFDHGDEIDLDALSKQLSEIDIYGDAEREARRGGGGGGGGGGDFAGDLDNLFAGFGAPPPAETSSSPPPPRSSQVRRSGASTSASRPSAPRSRGNQPPRRNGFKVRHRQTGKRAFQGLIEPDPDTRVVDLVLDFLSRLR